MAKIYLSFLLFVSTLLLGISISVGALSNGTQVYIVNMGAPPRRQGSTPYRIHISMLKQLVKRRAAARSALLYSYKNCFNGFAAKLKPQQLQTIKQMQGVIGVHESKVYKLQTTGSWDSMGFSTTIKRNAQVESDLIVGVIDSGVWPESESFRDDGIGPPPKKWKGICQNSGNFTCNNKLIGARFYKSNPSPSDSARDLQGHGTHTASIAAGREVQGASFFGLAQGTARGGVPSARIAVYKACWEDGCYEHSVLAAMDDAINDGVDIISLSLGFSDKFGFHEDSISVGAFQAMSRGILTLQAVGNDGPKDLTVGSWAPWILTVGASTTGRQFVDKVELGDGQIVEGIGINPFEAAGNTIPMVDVCDCRSPDGCCDLQCDMKGKIAFCKDENNAGRIFAKGAAGMVTLMDSTTADFSRVYALPSSRLNDAMASNLTQYLKSTKDPKARIQKAVVQQSAAAPMPASFSSRGPNMLARHILKPDISAPGVGIVAAYTPAGRVSKTEGDTRSAKYSIMSGTSMACPHVAGAAAYVKSFHRDWSPSAIKSALMTTAFPMKGNPAVPMYAEDVFSYGAGHMDPVKAVEPGLVYDAREEDYVDFLCAQRYEGEALEAITGHKLITCPEKRIETKDLNYPTITKAMTPTETNGTPFSVNFTRTVTNVGTPASSTYKATLAREHPTWKFNIEPSTLQFQTLGEKKTFVVTVTGSWKNETRTFDTAILWSDGVHNVRTSLVLYSSYEYFMY